MSNIDSEYSVEQFIDYLKGLDINKQKRMLFMIEAGQTISDELEYDTSFGHYKDFVNSTDVMIMSKFYINYRRFFSFVCGGNVINKPDDVSKKGWDSFKKIFLQELRLSETIFGNDYKSFKEGLKLKELRDSAKKEFSEKSGLSLYKITQVEDYGFRSKKSEFDQYWVGLKKAGLDRTLKFRKLKKNF